MAEQDKVNEHEEALAEHRIEGYNADDPRDKMYLGIITKLRAQRRTIAAESQTALEKAQAEIAAREQRLDALTKDLGVYKRNEREGQLLAEALGSDHELTDHEKFWRWAKKLSGGEDWESDFKSLALDFARPITAAVADNTTKPDEKVAVADEKKPEEKVVATDEKKPEEKSPLRMFQKVEKTGGVPQQGTHVAIDARSPSALLKLAKTDPDAYEAYIKRA